MRSVKAFLALIFLFPSLIVINGIQTLSLLLRPFSFRAFRGINRWAANTWWGWCDRLAISLAHTEVVITGDDLPVQENALVILNHQGMIDIPVVFRIARLKERLGDLKWFVKDILKYVPGIGWGMLFLDCLFIKRDWTADKDSIAQVFNKLVSHQTPCWLISFVEGTRATPAKLARSQDYAKKMGHRPLSHVQIPRTKGFVAAVMGLKNHITAVYDFTIAYTKKAPSLWQWIKGDAGPVYLHVRRFDFKTLPTDSAKLSQWLVQRFEEKDQRLTHFHLQGTL